MRSYLTGVGHFSFAPVRPSLLFAFLAATVRWWERRIESGVAIEKAHRLEHEIDASYWHHRPVLQASNVRHPERVPEDHVRILDTPVRLRPLRQARTSCMLVGVLPRWEAFFPGIGRNPQILAGERCPLDPRS